MSMGIPGSILSPKGKLVRPGLRQRFARPRAFGTFSQDEEADSATHHQPRSSMPEMQRPDSHIISSASERVLRKPKRTQLKTAPTKVSDVQRDRKVREVSVLNAEKGSLLKEIAVLQQEMKGLKRTFRREETGDSAKQDLDQVLAGMLHASLSVKSQLDQYNRIFQRMYRTLLHEEDYSEDLVALRKALEHSGVPKNRFTSLSPKHQVKETALDALLRRTAANLEGWKKAVS